MATASFCLPQNTPWIAHEYGLKDELDVAWAVRPLEFVRERGRTILVLEESGRRAARPAARRTLRGGALLRLAIGIAYRQTATFAGRRNARG